MARRPKVANVEVNSGRYELRVVGDAEDDADDVALHRAPELLGDVVGTQAVLERQVEEVPSLKHVEADLSGTYWTLEWPTTAVHVYVDEASQLRHVTTQHYYGDKSTPELTGFQFHQV